MNYLTMQLNRVNKNREKILQSNNAEMSAILGDIFMIFILSQIDRLYNKNIFGDNLGSKYKRYSY